MRRDALEVSPIKRNSLRILGLCGSLEHRSSTMRALEAAMEGAGASKAQCKIIDLRNYQIPIFNSPHKHSQSLIHVKKIIRACRWADGFIMASPEYHGSISGALKNVLDWMGFEEFEGKIVGLVGVAGGDMGAFNALGHLSTICRQLHAWVVPLQISIARSHEAFEAGGRIVDPKLRERLRLLGREVARFTLLHKQRKSQDFLKLWEEYVANPGGAGR